MICHDRHRHRRSRGGISTGRYDRPGTGWRQCGRYWPCCSALPLEQRKRVIIIGIRCCDRSANRIRRHSDAIAADTRASARRWNSSPMGLLEDVARAAHGIAGSACKHEMLGDATTRGRTGRASPSQDLQPGDATDRGRRRLDVSGQRIGCSGGGTGAAHHPRLWFAVVRRLDGRRRRVLGRLLQKHRWIAYVGLATIVYVGCEMIYRGAQELKPVIGAVRDMFV